MTDILLVNACVRPESRTLRLAHRLLDRLGGQVTEVDLQREALRPLDAETLGKRDALLARGETDDPMLHYARQFAAAKQIVVAAPYWDLSFPAAVKTYFEHVTVNGVTFSCGADGRPVSHCRAERLFYVMTAGGPILPPNHGYGYVKSLAETFYGIPETVCFPAELLDVDGMDAEAEDRRVLWLTGAGTKKSPKTSGGAPPYFTANWYLHFSAKSATIRKNMNAV